ncbi:MAG: MauE/DoxX family redox-associated membrane protein [Ilumatobacter sp.]
MDVVSTLSGIAIGVVLIIAGGAKLADRSRWATDAAALGAPHAAVSTVPWIELVLGSLLVVGVASPWPAIAAAGLFAVFTVAIVNVLRSGRRPSCACFGSWSSSELSSRHVVRNTVLIVFSLLASI